MMKEKGGPRDVEMSSVTVGTDWTTGCSARAIGDCSTRYRGEVVSSTCPAAHIQEQRTVL